MAAKAPFLHRRHDNPDVVKIETLAKTLGEMGIPAGNLIGCPNTHKALQDILDRTQSHPLAGIINSLMVRSMKQAVYSPESSGHFGIATNAYAHFTSPIRRYPDLMAHRAVKALLLGKKENHFNPNLAEAGAHCSERERGSAEAEYKAVDIMRAELFKGRIGEVMDGTVTSVIERGSFVLCRDTGVEGMLRVTNLKPGTKVRVIVDAVDVVDGKIDLSLALKPKLPPQLRLTPWKRPKRNRR
jgi:ribonuclease R